jgi:hypothetical protein
MISYLLDEVSAGSATRFAQESGEGPLATSIDELAGLRFSIILTARWETSASGDWELRDDLRGRLARLRRDYSNKIDEIAMSFGVQFAMDAKEEVERSMYVPRGISLPLESSDEYEDEDNAAGI